MRNIKTYYGGVLLPFGSSGVINRLPGLSIATSSKQYQTIGNTDSGNRLVFADGYNEEKLRELYRRFLLIGFYMKAHAGDYSEEQFLGYRNNLRQLSRVLYTKGLDRPSATMEDAQGLAGYWVSDYIAFTHSQMMGPVEPPGWCG